jgi:hypothetical protein
VSDFVTPGSGHLPTLRRLRLRTRFSFLWLGIAGFFAPDFVAEKLAEQTVQALKDAK